MQVYTTTAPLPLRPLVPLPTLLLMAALLLPTIGQAWGPATHATHWRDLKKELAAEPDASSPPSPALRRLLLEHPDAFTFGCIVPDIRELTPKGDKLRSVTHKYAFIFAMLEHAGTPAEQAFALGNLAHLAQDTGAQLFYVPHQMCRHRIGSFRLAGASQEDLIEGMVELYHSDAGLLRRALKRRTPELVTFYAESIKTYLSGKRETDDIAPLVDRFCRLAVPGSRVGKPVGLVLNAVILPLSALKTGLANPLNYSDAAQFRRLGNTIFLDLADKREKSDWFRNWPTWSRNVQLFGGTQGGKAFRKARCRNGLILYNASFTDERGKRRKQLRIGEGKCVLNAELSCTMDVAGIADFEVCFKPPADAQWESLARLRVPVRMSVSDPNHRRQVAVPFLLPKRPGTVYFTLDVDGGRKGTPELSSLTPHSKRAKAAGWPPVLDIVPDKAP